MELEQAFQGAYVFSGNVARWGFLPLAESSQTLEWLTADGRKSPQLQAPDLSRGVSDFILLHFCCVACPHLSRVIL